MIEKTDSGFPALLKQRLFGSISVQIDAMAHVPEDMARICGDPAGWASLIAEAPVAADVDNASAAGAADRIEGLAASINRHYDQTFFDRDGPIGRLIGESDFRNIGYWDEGVETQHQAAERLQDALLAYIPEPIGRVLDVACGLGGSTRRLCQRT